MRAIVNLQRYGLTTIACGVALIVAWWWNAPSSCFFLAVVVSSLYGGRGPGFWSVALSVLARDFFFLTPRFHLLPGSSDSPRLAIFSGVLLLVSYLISAKLLSVDALHPTIREGEIDPSFQPILWNIPGFVAVMSATGRAEYVSIELLNYFGKSMAELSRWESTDAVHPDDLPLVLERWKRSVETGDAYEIDHRLRRADGVYRWFHVRGRPERDSAGQILFA